MLSPFVSVDEFSMTMIRLTASEARSKASQMRREFLLRINKAFNGIFDLISSLKFSMKNVAEKT